MAKVPGGKTAARLTPENPEPLLADGKGVVTNPEDPMPVFFLNDHQLAVDDGTGGQLGPEERSDNGG